VDTIYDDQMRERRKHKRIKGMSVLDTVINK